MRLVYKVWIDNNGKAFGEGPYELLKGIEQAGSLRKAASGMGMSYNQAWRLIKTIEERLGFSLIESTVGGTSGGGSAVTPRARRLMESYKSFRAEVEETLERLFMKHFDHLA
ncbi:MAG: LysR family transcriptional regulator [Peptococcaceae bacterium]|nr:LysR family transcriptional regulator [Peptococcaceae bacterium]